jgi:RNA polymerase sigma factor (sigma-70 family)
VLGSEGRGDWDDSCQEIFLRVFMRMETWEGRGRFCKWLAVVAARRAIDARDPRPFERLPPGEIPDRPRRDPRWPPETIACIESVLAKLPPERRRAFEQSVEGVPREEIARAAGKKVRMIHYWLAAVRDQLLACLSE